MKIKFKFFIFVFLIISYISAVFYISFTQSEYCVSFKTEQSKYAVSANNDFTIPVTVKNRGKTVLDSDKDFFLSYHLLDVKGNLIVFDGVRTPFSKKIEIFDNTTENLLISKLQPGEYYLQLDIVQEGVCWFSQKKTEPEYVYLMVN